MRRYQPANVVFNSSNRDTPTAESQATLSSPPRLNDLKLESANEKSRGHLSSSDRRPLHPAVRFEIRMRAGGRCTHPLVDGSLCNSSKDLEIHHIIEVAHGGTDQIENLQLLCRKHHQEKHVLYDFESRPAYRSWVRAPVAEYSA